MTPRPALDRIFEPRSIAVVGASTDPAKRGYQIVRALGESGYEGSVHPVNPRGGTLLGLEVATSVADLPSGIDLAVLCTPGSAAPDLLRALGERHVAGTIVLAVGFGESGEDGERLQADLVRAGAESGVRILGPNTSGFLNLHTGVNLVGARGVRAGGLSLLVQSGNIALSLMTEVTERSWDGISVYFGVGNEVDLGFSEALEWLADHERTSAIICYVEGLRDGRAFLRAAASTARRKPIVAIKSGRTRSGVEAARSHTGTISGPYARLRAGLAQAGVVEVTRTDELLHVAETLGRQPPCPTDRAIAILSDGGGQGTLAADVLAEAGATLAELRAETRTALRELLGPAAAVRNPVDVAGATDLDPEVFGRAVDLLAADPGVGTIFLIGLFGGYGIRFAERLTEPEVRAAEAMSGAAGKAGVGLVVHTMYAAHRSRPLEVLGEAGVPVIGSLEVACRCAVELQRRGRALARPEWTPYDGTAGASAPTTPKSTSTSPSAVARARAEGRSALTEPEAREVLTAAGLAFEKGVVAMSAEEAGRAVVALGRPAALKLVSSTILHKSDAGGVVLDVTTAEEAVAAFARIAERTGRYAVDHGLAPGPTSVLVTPMLPSPRAELLIGAVADPHVGPALTVGAGGIWVEVLADVSNRVLPVTDADIEAMLSELRIAGLLEGGRGRAPIARDPLLRAVRAVATCLEASPEIAEVEINPLFVYDDRVVPVDARITLE